MTVVDCVGRQQLSSGDINSKRCSANTHRDKMKDHATEHYTPVRDFTLSTPTKYHSTTWHNPQPDAQNAADRDTTERCYHAIVSRAKVADLTSSAPRNQSTTAPYHNTGRTDVDARNVEDHKTTDQRGHSATAFQAKVADLTSSAQKNRTMDDYRLEMHWQGAGQLSPYCWSL